MNVQKHPNQACKVRVKSMRDLYIIWSQLDDGAKIRSTTFGFRSIQFGYVGSEPKKYPNHTKIHENI